MRAREPLRHNRKIINRDNFVPHVVLNTLGGLEVSQRELSRLLEEACHVIAKERISRKNGLDAIDAAMNEYLRVK